MPKRGAPRGNTNATGSGLYTTSPTQKVVLPDSLHAGSLSVPVRDMADAALSLAEQLAEKAELVGHDAAKAAGLYAKVGDELYKLTAELLGVSGIKPSPYGKLSSKQFDSILRNRRRALELMLSQVATAYQRISDHEVIEGNGLVIEINEYEGGKVVATEYRLNPVLGYMAGHMRSAGRSARELAADLAWYQQQKGAERGAAQTLLKMINKESKSNE